MTDREFPDGEAFLDWLNGLDSSEDVSERTQIVNFDTPEAR